MILKDETILTDDYPIHCGYAYIADGRVVCSDIEGTVSDLKRDIGANEIRRCSIIKRQKMEATK